MNRMEKVRFYKKKRDRAEVNKGRENTGFVESLFRTLHQFQVRGGIFWRHKELVEHNG